jgi:hypothetical protein
MRMAIVRLCRLITSENGGTVLVCTVGKTFLSCDSRCIEDLHAMLKSKGVDGVQLDVFSLSPYPVASLTRSCAMGIVSGLMKAAAGAGAGVALLTALPVFGAVGVITATGMAVGSVIGAAAGITEEVMEYKKRKKELQRR